VLVGGFFLEILFHGSTSCSHRISSVENIYHHIRRVNDLQSVMFPKCLLLYIVHSRCVYFDPLTGLLHGQVESSRSPCRRRGFVVVSSHRRILVLTLPHQQDQRVMHSHLILLVFSLLSVQKYYQTTLYPRFELSVAKTQPLLTTKREIYGRRLLQQRQR